MTPEARAEAMLAAISQWDPARLTAELPHEIAARHLREAENAVLDKIIAASASSASAGARRIADLALSMKHREPTNG